LGIALCFGYTGLGQLPILKGGTDAQKKKWLEPVIAGDHGISFCLSEPGAGSDVPGMTTKAEKKGDKYVINGAKQWITGGGSADAYTVFAYTDKNRGTRGVSCFYVPRDTPGLIVGKKEDKLGIRASDTRQIIFEDCAVPAENLIGRENMGFVYALLTLNASRPYVAAMGVGVGQAALDYAAKYAREREQFGQKIGTFQAVQHMLADMSITVEVGREITYRAARMSDAGDPNLAKYSAIAKAFTSEGAMKCALDAVQIYGGYGYTKEYPVEKLMRDAKILCIFEGTTQIQKNEIAAYVTKEAASGK
jgi:alkylation response protein AidB-like acyl-CoA dehydrogenase